MHHPHSSAAPTACPSPEGLVTCPAQPLPTTHAPPLPVSPADQPLGTRAKPCPPSHVATPHSCRTVQAPLSQHMRHSIHRHHMKTVCCSLSQVLCFSFVLTLFNNSLCLPLSHPKVIIHTVTQIGLGNL